VSAKKRAAAPGQTDRHGTAGLLTTIVTSWPNTIRTLVITVVVILVVAFVLWWLKADLTAGPVSVTGHDSHSAPVVSNSPHNDSTGTSGGR